MKKIFQFLALLFCCTACESCEREYPEIDFKLPAETQTGANTFGFLVNGKVWTNYGQHCSFYGCLENLQGSMYRPENKSNWLFLNADMYIREDQKDKLDQNFAFEINRLDSVGTYWIDSLNLDNEVRFFDALASKGYQAKYTKPGFKFMITKLDTVNRIVSGRFEGILYNDKNLRDSLIIRDGRFDLNLQ